MGRLAGIWVHPVKSLAAVPATTADVTAAGLVGDRTRTVVDAATGERLRERTAPGLGTVVPTGDDEADAAAVTAVVGRPATVVAAAEPQVMVAAVHLVSRQALARATDGVVPAGCSPADPRANLVLDLPAADERDWVGREVVVGTARLRITGPPRHCLGVYAEVLVPGAVAVGDVVELG